MGGYDFENKPGRSAARGIFTGWGWLLLILALVLVTSAALWGLGVVTAPWQGKGEAFKQRESADNRIEAQAAFQTKFNSIKGLDEKVTIAQRSLEAYEKRYPHYQGNGTPYDPVLEHFVQYETERQGAEQVCVGAVADYNATAKKYLFEEFRDSELPYEITSSDPVTDCRPTESVAAVPQSGITP